MSAAGAERAFLGGSEAKTFFTKARSAIHDLSPDFGLRSHPRRAGRFFAFTGFYYFL
jgi:hypothetical protein